MSSGGRLNRSMRQIDRVACVSTTSIRSDHAECKIRENGYRKSDQNVLHTFKETTIFGGLGSTSFASEKQSNELPNSILMIGRRP